MISVYTKVFFAFFRFGCEAPAAIHTPSPSLDCREVWEWLTDLSTRAAMGVRDAPAMLRPHSCDAVDCRVFVFLTLEFKVLLDGAHDKANFVVVREELQPVDVQNLVFVHFDVASVDHLVQPRTHKHTHTFNIQGQKKRRRRRKQMSNG